MPTLQKARYGLVGSAGFQPAIGEAEVSGLSPGAGWKPALL
jgi:hypothetical protein